uniref:BED-type domain-containing protein n=1 Tax=Populus davidiana TaxID=266767 RepID=A0A6M2F7E9_9ROSI
MEETSKQELLINKILRTLQRKCLKLWEVDVREVNEASGSEVRLDDERMPNIPYEKNGYMTVNPTSNQAEETREPLQQDVQEQSAIPAPALNGENASPSVDGGLQSTSKRRKISTVWDRFVKHRGENGEVWATCKYCKKKYRAESKRGTSNLHKHLKNCSPSGQDEAEQQILVETGELSTSVIQGNFVIDQERSRLDIATIMTKHGYPLTMVQLYSKDVVEADVLAIYRTEKEKLINFFDKLSCLLSLTLELWSSTDKMMTYCCFTVHFIDDGWQLKKKILAFRNLRYNYDMGTVHEVFKSVLAEWSINKNVRFIFLDITPPKDHMVGELRSKVSDQAPPIHGHLFCVPSYAQILSLLVQDGFSEIRSVLYKIRECIEYVNESSLRRQKFEAINNGSLQGREMPTLDVPARWDTTFLMLESSLEFITAFNLLEQLDDDFKVNPSAEEWNKATAVFECLKEFYKSTCNFPTSRDDYFLSVRNVCKNLHGWKQSEHPYVRSMANRMKGKFDEYWGEASLALGISAVLDPYFKLDIIEYGYRQIYDSDADLQLSRFRYDLTCAYHKYAEDISNQGPSSSAMADVSRCTSSDISFKEWRKGKYERNMVPSQWNELDQYLQLPPENLDKDGNVLAWWQDNARNFPILGKMARDFYQFRYQLSFPSHQRL